MKKGIELYRKNHPEVIYTYDVTHGMANLLKKELVSSEIYQKFLSDCRQCRQELQQTEFAFLAPPRKKLDKLGQPSTTQINHKTRGST